ncbi:ribosome maturation factor RimM [Ornithinibacillus sp. BX22]|uniref:Ribosome maturation factor RimM n=2 Tax=Ornithinibacillus TaxID=484508 RepID=A0A923L3S1_9BACI|nr:MULTISPECIES: ribosome maturation factor RimM [Ornithinibacillus]MBC5635939.1 ribosome maturation factor RimM [Ornithinibacillus hominis]MBS3680072.1 ribosome maturation factor RimM [Ornithinibacillus massiliensis]
MEEKMFTVGKIINTHGIRGDLKVLRVSDFDDRFKVGNLLYLVTNQKVIRELEIDGHRIHKGFDLIHFKGLDNINDVEHFKGSTLKIKESQLTELDENEYYYHEIIGCEVFTTDGDSIGKVKEILAPGANDVWVVKQPKGKDILIPYIEEVVIEIDVDHKRIMIEPMEGLLD